jgi:rod shape-determining protein MreD
MNITRKTKLHLSIFISFLVAALLASVPLPKFLYWIWPQWIVLVMMFWILNLPDRLGFGTAFGIGLLQDALSGSMLGEHGLVLTIITYLLLKFNNKIIFSRISAQMLTIFMLMLLYQALLYWVHGIIKNLPSTPNYWLSSITSALIWPYVVKLLNKYVQSYKTRY